MENSIDTSVYSYWFESNKIRLNKGVKLNIKYCNLILVTKV